jgi:predicted RNA polymerase sigma factor
MRRGARAAYLEAIALCHNETELTFLRNRVAELADPD